MPVEVKAQEWLCRNAQLLPRDIPKQVWRLWRQDAAPQGLPEKRASRSMTPDQFKEFIQAVHNMEWSLFWIAVWTAIHLKFE